jgi:uncharacterized delta-60 repeat protein
MKKNLLLMFATASTVSYAQPGGTPDPTFGTAGVVTTFFGSSHAGSNSMAIQNDGKIVMAGYQFTNAATITFAVARYNTNGTLDNSFDGDGKVTTIIGANDEANAVAIQTDGKIVVAGESTLGVTDVFAIARYKVNGTLDSTFDGDGIVTTSITSSGGHANAKAIQLDGKIIVAGSSFGQNNTDFGIARYNSNGSLDSTFDGDGIVVTDIGSSDNLVNALVIQPDGKIVAAGSTYNGSTLDFAIARYTTEGSLDNTFSGDGKLIIPSGGDSPGEAGLAIQTDGKVLIAGGDGSRFFITRINRAGIPDSTFGGDGIVTTLIGSRGEATSVIVQPDGKIVTAGHAFTGIGYDFAVARYNTNGSLDNSFDADGKLTKNVNGNDLGYAMKLSGQRIYAGGVSNQVVFTLLAFQTGAIVLPLQLIHFTASKYNNSNILNWQTASEQNTSHFDIERSSEGIFFSKIGQVLASVNSTSLKNYSFTDLRPTAGINYYRLKMMGADGHFTYSNVLVVKMNTVADIEIFPNPVLNVLQVQLTASQNKNTLLQIQDVAGKIIKQENIASGGNQISTTIDVSGLPKGVYFLVVKNEKGTIIKKIIKQ